MTTGYLSTADIRALDRDLQILITTNGTLTRILEVISEDEIDVNVIEQSVHQVPPAVSGLEGFPSGPTLRRQVLLRGRRSGVPYVAAESYIAAERLPADVTATLRDTDRPIGEIVLASCIETYKDAAKVWVAPTPDWAGGPVGQGKPSTTYARRYRMIAGGLPVICISEYFLVQSFASAARNDGV